MSSSFDRGSYSTFYTGLSSPLHLTTKISSAFHPLLPLAWGSAGAGLLGKLGRELGGFPLVSRKLLSLKWMDGWWKPRKPQILTCWDTSPEANLLGVGSTSDPTTGPENLYKSLTLCLISLLLDRTPDALWNKYRAVKRQEWASRSKIMMTCKNKGSVEMYNFIVVQPGHWYSYLKKPNTLIFRHIHTSLYDSRNSFPTSLKIWFNSPKCNVMLTFYRETSKAQII